MDDFERFLETLNWTLWLLKNWVHHLQLLLFSLYCTITFRWTLIDYKIKFQQQIYKHNSIGAAFWNTPNCIYPIDFNISLLWLLFLVLWVLLNSVKCICRNYKLSLSLTPSTYRYKLHHPRIIIWKLVWITGLLLCANYRKVFNVLQKIQF